MKLINPTPLYSARKAIPGTLRSVQESWGNRSFETLTVPAGLTAAEYATKLRACVSCSYPTFTPTPDGAGVIEESYYSIGD